MKTILGRSAERALDAKSAENIRDIRIDPNTPASDWDFKAKEWKSLLEPFQNLGAKLDNIDQSLIAPQNLAIR